MAEYSCFFNSYDGDRMYTAGEFASYFSDFIGNGVYYGGNGLKVNVYNAMTVQVLTGKGYINGYAYRNADVPKLLSLENSLLTKPRIDRIVLRLNLSDSGRFIHLAVKTGVGSDTPTAPALQRDNAIWELGLADIYIQANTKTILQSNITDLRLDKSFCGVVTCILLQPDLTSIFNQYQSKYSEIRAHWDSFFSDTTNEYVGWFNQIKAELYSTVCSDFDDWSRRAGYSMVIEFCEDGRVMEVIKNKSNLSTLASRETKFETNGEIKEIIHYRQPYIYITKTTTPMDFGFIESYT